MIQNIFQDIKTSKHWDEQISLLNEVQYNEQNARMLNNSKYSQVIKDLLLNPRSKLLTSTIDFLIEIFERYGPLVHNFALNLLGSDIMFKLLNSGNKIISKSINQLIKSIVINSPHSKFYTIFSNQFNSKNVNVRECISSYLLVLANHVEYPTNFNNFVRKGLADPNKNVRRNIQSLTSIISQTETTNQCNKTRKVLGLKNLLAQENQLKPKNDSKNNSLLFDVDKKYKNPAKYGNQENQEGQYENSGQIIADSFLQDNQEHNQKFEIQFLIDKIQSEDQLWNSKFLAIQALFQMVDQNSIPDDCFVNVFWVILELINEKRSKVYLSAYPSLKALITYHNTQYYKLALAHNVFIQISKKCIKSNKLSKDILTELIEKDPIDKLISLSQLSLDVKSVKQKIVLLDIVAQAFCKYKFEESKVSVIVKIICEHIRKFNHSKEIYMPCMVIFSHFRVVYPRQLLSCLLTQGNQTLQIILQIAEDIDPLLRQGIINYIHDLKGNNSSTSNITQKKSNLQLKQEQFQSQIIQKSKSNLINCFQPQSDSESKELINTQFTQLIEAIKQSEQASDESVRNLAAYLFPNYQHLTMKNFFEIIKLTQNLTSQNLLMDLQLFLQELCKIKSMEYLEALFEAINTCNINSIEKQYIFTYLQKISLMIQEFRDLVQMHHADKIIKLYRVSKCPKIRMSCINLLGLFPEPLYSELVTDKQSELIITYRKKNVKIK